MGGRWSKVTKQAAAFGAAMAALGGAGVAEGAVVSLTPNPGSVPYSGTAYVTLGVPGLTFLQLNTYGWKAFGSSTSYGSATLNSFRATAYGNTITTGLPFGNYVSVPPSASGTATFAFRTQTNQLGWIRMSFGGSGGPVNYLAAAYETTPGAPIIAGAPVPEPGTAALLGLGLLALGAAGVKKLRRGGKSAS